MALSFGLRLLLSVRVSTVVKVTPSVDVCNTNVFDDVPLVYA